MPVAHHAALPALFDLVDASARSDLRNELLQGLLKKRQDLLTRRTGAAPSELELLEADFEAIGSAIERINRTVGRLSQRLRENEWLQLVRTRQSIPGGTCAFDMPTMHHWLSKPAEERRADLEGWVAPMSPTRDAIVLLLKTMRASCLNEDLRAAGGSYQRIATGKQYTIAQVALPRDSLLIPEVSVNKYRLWVRFSRPDADRRLHAVTETVEFRLGLCE